MKKILLTLVGIICSLGMFAGDFPTGKTWDLTKVKAEIDADVTQQTAWSEMGTEVTTDGVITDATYYSGAVWYWNSTYWCNYYKNTSSYKPIPLYITSNKTCTATDGLKFYWNGYNKVRITADGFNLQSTNSFIVIPNLVKNQKVTITSAVALSAKSNLTAVSTSGTSYVFKATADGDVQFTYSSSKGNISKIAVDAEPAATSDKSISASFSKTTLNLSTGDTFMMPTLTVKDEDNNTLTAGTDYTIAYSSNNTSVMSNDQELVATETGSATITATITLIGTYATGYVVDSNPTYIVNFTKYTTINRKAICTVDTDNDDALTDAQYFVNTLKAQSNTDVTVDGVTYTKGLKTESSTNISFKTGSNPALLKVVFSPYSGKSNMKLNGTAVSADANNVYYGELDANTVYKITKNDQAFIYYIGVFEKFKKITVSDAGYATWYAEYDSSLPAGVTIYTAAVSSDKTTLDLTETGSNLVAKNSGVILKAETGDYYINETNQSVTTNSALTGTVTGTTISEEDYVLGNGENGVGFYHLNSPYQVGANKAYLLASATSGAKNLSFSFGETTQINAISSNVNNEGVAYNIAGQRVNDNTKGMVIVNGKKFFNK